MLIILVLHQQKKKKVRSTVVKFRSRESRAAFYKPRRRNHLDRQKKPGSNFNVSLDLTKRPYNLLAKARRLVISNALVTFAFNDICYSLVLKFSDNTFYYLNNKHELNNLLNSQPHNNQLFIVGDTRLSSCCVD